MRIIRFTEREKMKYGVLKGRVIQSILGSPFEQFTSPGCLFDLDGSTHKLDEVRLLAPCAPSKIICVEINHKTYYQEDPTRAIIEQPIINLQPSTAVIGVDDTIILPKHHKNICFEGELGIVIGKRAKDVQEEKAKEYVLGYTCHNDVADLDVLVEEPNGYPRAKSFDTFAPIGPWIETEIDPDDLKIDTCLNGKLIQSYRTSSFIFNISKLISFITGVMTLLPGDIISTGSPKSLGPVKPNDVVEISIENINTLRNTVFL